MLRTWPLILAGLLSSAACSSSTTGSSGRPCTLASDCPADQRCVDGRCRPGSAVDGGSDGGPGTDAGRDTGAPPPPPPRDGGGPGEDGGGEEDASCGGGAIPIVLTPPNVLVVLDRSCSMRRRLDGVDFGAGPEDPTTRWYVAREAVRRMTERYPGRVRWGLMAFPDPREGCGDVPRAEVAPAPLTEAAVIAELLRDEIQPFGLCGSDNTDTTTQPRETPMEEALAAAATVPELMDATRDNYVLLIADGGASCGATAGSLTTVTTGLLSGRIQTAAIGFTVGSTEETLEAVGANGGLPRPGGSPSFYSADDAADLDAAIDAIIIPAIPCTFALADTPPDPDAIFVTVNDAPLAADPADGYTYDATANALTLHGAACMDLRTGAIRRIQVAFGCPPSACEPQPEVCNGLDDDCDDRVDEECLL